MKLTFTSLVHVCLIAFSAGEQCQRLDGLWYSAIGSQMQLTHSENRILLGSYFAVDGELGIDSVSEEPHDITGAAVFNQTGAVFGLSVLYMNGASVKAWTGQCLMDGTDEVLETSWMLRQRAGDCSDKWTTTSIGEMVFKRQSGINKLKQLSAFGKREKRQAETTPSTRQPCSLLGHWYNELGSEMYIAYHQNATLRGLYHTAVEMSNGSAGENDSIVYGVANELDTSTAIALHVVWNNGGSVTGWVGQCQFCGPNQTEIITTTWLLRGKADSYDDNWSATNVGYDYFTRYVQRPGRRK